MKTLLFVFALLSSVDAFSQSTSRLAQKDPLFTIEHWSGNEAMVWAVQSDQIVVYRTFDTQEPDLLVGPFSISAEQLRKIREAVAAIPEGTYGTLIWQGGFLHGPLLRLSFTPDGSLAGTRIELGGVYEAWLRPICAAISDAVPAASKIGFEEAVKERHDLLAKTGNVPPTVRTLIDDYYVVELHEQRSRPKKSPETTSGK